MTVKNKQTMRMKKSLLIVIFTCTIALYSFGQTERKGVTIVIQPFGDIPSSYVSYFYQQAEQIVPGIIIKAAVPLPQSSYFVPSNRYRADSLLDFLDRNTPAGQVTIGLTDLPRKNRTILN